MSAIRQQVGDQHDAENDKRRRQRKRRPSHPSRPRGHRLAACHGSYQLSLSRDGCHFVLHLSGGLEPRGSTAAAQTAETASAALEVLRKSISVDVHTHGGASGIISKAPPNDDLVNGMRAGSLAVACLADVPDAPILGRNAAGVLTALRIPPVGANEA